MSTPPPVRLSREVRFGVHPAPPAGPRHHSGASNGFAGNPMLAGLVPFAAVTVTVSGGVDPRTGMLVNIKVIDGIVRDVAVGLVRGAEPLGTGRLATALFDALARELSGRGHRVEGVQFALSPYLHVAVTREERPMVRLSQRFEFSAAHRLHCASMSESENLEVFGRCNNPNGHGHNYELEVTVVGAPDPKTGAVMPVEDLQRVVTERIIDVYDHKHLNLDCVEFRDEGGVNPTVENIARVLYGRLKGHIPAPAVLASVRVWETPKTMCEYSE